MLENVTKGKKLDIEVIFLRGLKEKSLGVIDKNGSSAFLLKTRFGIHTFFVRVPLDIILLSDKGKVIKIKQNMEPNRVFFWNPKYSFVLEAPAGCVKKLDLEIGNMVEV